MKLLYCKRCHDIIKLSHRLNTCECGQTKGMYINDLHIQYAGIYAVPLEVVTSSLTKAIKNQPEKETKNKKGGASFEAFVIPKKCSSMERLS